MTTHTYTGIFAMTFLGNNNNIIIKYTTIRSTEPRKFKTLEKFKDKFDLNTLYWTSSIDEIYEIAKTNEQKQPTSHGIVKIDYTKEEYLVDKIMYADEYKYLIGIKHILYYGFHSIIAILYLAFIIKLYNCLA
jgi:hypothetical protein